MASVEKLAFYLLNKVNEAIRNYEVIDGGGRTAVAVSGGKDSLWLLDLVYHGRLEILGPKVSFFDGEITLIRPRLYVPEKELVRFAKACGFPVEGPPCPSGLACKRSKMRETSCVHLRRNPQGSTLTCSAQCGRTVTQIRPERQRRAARRQLSHESAPDHDRGRSC